MAIGLEVPERLADLADRMVDVFLVHRRREREPEGRRDKQTAREQQQV
jgi:hypothetical protein